MSPYLVIDGCLSHPVTPGVSPGFHTLERWYLHMSLRSNPVENKTDLPSCVNGGIAEAWLCIIELGASILTTAHETSNYM